MNGSDYRDTYNAVHADVRKRFVPAGFVVGFCTKAQRARGGIRGRDGGNGARAVVDFDDANTVMVIRHLMHSVKWVPGQAGQCMRLRFAEASADRSQTVIILHKKYVMCNVSTIKILRA